jgi:hypothetical protein
MRRPESGFVSVSKWINVKSLNHYHAMKGIEEFKDKRVGAILSALVIQFGFVFALKTYRDHFQKEKVNLGCALRTLRKYFGSDPAMYKSIALDHIESYNKSMEQHYVPQEVEGDPVTLDI